MSTTSNRTLEDVRHAGLAALAKALGPADMVRFIRQFGGGHGDYTKDRKAALAGISLRDAVAEMRALTENPVRPSARRGASPRTSRARPPVHA